ncbi:NADP-dependent oxidoreductase domain-containing protein [Xylogone sp. PMI_703]|nr:NADP-dependent oxidoreductase domain-containing protein [Xylogone sp. PMI_703]
MAATICGKPVGPVGYGLLFNSDYTIESAVKVMKTALDNGANYWNGGTFYGPPDKNSLVLINAYFTKYPEDRDKVVINIKGGVNLAAFIPDNSEENLRETIDQCLKVLDGKHKLDVFECGRVDPNVPIEDEIRFLASLVKEGKIDGIGLSEVNANTIRRAHAIHPIASVEVEASLWTPNIFSNGVAATCAELGIPVLAYSPLGHGVLTGKYKTVEDIKGHRYLPNNPRFQPGVFEKNLELVDAIIKLSEKKACTPAQIAIGWLRALSGKNGNPIIIPIPGSSREERVVENMTDVKLTDEDMKEIQVILDTFKITGERYGGHQEQFLDG